MTGSADAPKVCPLCGGQLALDHATIPFVLGGTVAVIKQVPAEVCDACGEPFLHSDATDVVSALLDKALASSADVSVITYPRDAPAAA
ncbi:MAG TPA: type II toxin-antitoxin system MqsA family antitoxin [Kofleriaceae bacterium]|nr:type II toxin-antitoxin system MqsA family antitoxin [Kofleriaceae bacterium]